MSKAMRNTIIVIAIVLLIFAIIFAVYTHVQTKPMNANTQGKNILADANTGLENMLGNIFQENNTLLNEPQTNSVQENDNNNQTSTPTIDDNQTTPRENKAIELARQQWKKDMGSLEDISFNVSIQSDGKYGVTVYDTTTTRSILFYIVDVDSGIVKER